MPERTQGSRSASIAPRALFEHAFPGLHEAARSFGFPIALFFATRTVWLWFAKFFLMTIPFASGSREIFPNNLFLNGLCRWDCKFFDDIAQSGYPNVGYSNFFPLYPSLVRATVWLGHSYDSALLLVSNGASLLSYIVIYRLFVYASGPASARAALVLFAAYPFAFFQATTYPESLAILLTATAVFLAMKGRHVPAGVVLGLGILARHVAVFAGAALLVAQIRRSGGSLRRFVLSPSSVGLALPFVVAGPYLFFLWKKFDDPFAFWKVRNAWGPSAWMGMREAMSQPNLNTFYVAYVVFSAMTIVGAGLLLVRRRWMEMAAYALVFSLILFFIGIGGLGRYSASCWPSFLPWGAALRRHPSALCTVAMALTLFQGYFFFLFTHGHGIN